MKVKLVLTTIIECNENAEELKNNRDYINADGKFVIDHMALNRDKDDDSFYVFDLVDAEDII